MAVVSMKQLLEAGVHFGHQTRRWNPKMAPYIFTERNGIYIIDLQKTVKKLDEAYNFIHEVAAEGGEVLFVGTKKQAADSIKVELNNFLLGKKIECTVVLHCVKLFKSIDSLLDGLEVCHHTAEPSCVYIVSVCSECFFLD